MHRTPAEPAIPSRRFTVAEWHRIIEAGVIGEDEHVQLIEGRLVPMTPQGEAHIVALSRLNRLLIRALSEEYSVRPQGPLSVGADSEPEPDLAVVRAADERAAAPSHPRGALLVVEVADTTLSFDRTVKQRLYARAGIPEFWIVDVAAKAVEVYRGPLVRAGRYRTCRVHRRKQVVRSSALPAVSVEVSALFA